MKRRVVIGTIVLAAICAVAWILLDSRQPRYEGKPLSYWLDRYQNVSGYGPDVLADEAVGQMGDAAIPELLRLLRSRESDLSIRWNRFAFQRHLIKTPPDSVGSRCAKAASAFAALGPAASNAVPELIRILETSDSPNAQRYAASALGSIGPAAKPAVPILLRRLSDTNRYVRRNSVSALGQIHAEPNVVVPALTNCMADGDSFVRVTAAAQLGNFGADARSAIPALTNALFDAVVIAPAATSLKQIAPEVYAQPDLMVPALINALKSSEAERQIWAADALVSFGTNARPAFLALAPLLLDDNNVVRIMAGRAVMHVDPTIRADVENPAVALGRELADKDGLFHAEAAYALTLLGPEARPAVPDMVRALAGEDHAARTSAEMALQKLDPAALAKARKEMNNKAAK